MIVHTATPTYIHHVFRHLAPERAAEMTATSWSDTPDVLGRDLETLCHASAHEGRPVLMFMLRAPRELPCAIVGVVPFGPGLGGMIWAATPEWPAIALPSHRWWRTYFVPEVLRKHYRRVEFTALASDAASRRWLKLLGFTEEGIAYRQGKRGEDFLHLAWLNPDPEIGLHV